MVRRRTRSASGRAAGLAAAVLAWVFAAWAAAAEVTVRVDRTEAVVGETVTLIIQTDDPEQSLETDLDALQQEFEVLDQRSETQMSIVNGQQTAQVRLLVTLEPRRSGILTIPALKFDGAASTPLQITVAPAPELAPGEAPPVFIELALDPEQGPYYVHAQLSLTVRIFYQQNLTEAAINPPAPDQASVRLLDEIPFQADRNGVRYRVLERRYAIFPERSGQLQIPPMQLTGRLLERPAQRLWQPSVRGRRVRIDSEPLSLEIEPRAAAFQGEHWLPARRITLSQQISDPDSLRVGEPVTRTVIVDTVGLEENMIEEPRWPALADARVYPDQPQGITRDDGRWVLGHKEFRYAVVPEKSGELVLPEVRVDWWDTLADVQRTAVLPEHRVTVAAPELPSGATAAAKPAAAVPGTAASAAAGPLAETGGIWRALAIVFAVLWVATLGVHLHLRRGATGRGRAPVEPGMPEDEAGLLRALRRSCADNDRTQTRLLLRRWLRAHGPRRAHGSVLEFARGVDDAALRDAIRVFDAGDFGTAPASQWEGEALWRAFSSWRQGWLGERWSRREPLPDLYRQPKPRPG